MNRDDHLIFEALQNNRGIKVHISDSIEDKQEGTSEAGYFPFTTTVKQFDAKHIAHALIKHAYGKYDQDRVEAALQSVLDSMEVNPYGEKKGIIELRIDEFPTDGMDHYVEARIVGKEENAENTQHNFTVVSGGVDNTSDVGIDINPADHIEAQNLKHAVESIIEDMQNDEEFNDTFPEEYREYVKDIFMMSNDNGDFIAVLPGHLSEDQIFTKLVDVRDNNSENAEGISFKRGDSVYFNDPDYPSYKNIVFQIRDLHGEDANLWSNELPSSGKPFWVKIKNLKKAR